MTAGRFAATEAPPLTNLVFAWLMAVAVMVLLWLLPGSGGALQTLTDWHDQSIFLSAARQTIEQGLPDDWTRVRVGPAYIGLTLAVGALFNLTPELSLILLSRLTFVACAGVLTFIALRQRAHAGPSMQLVLVAAAALSLLSSVWSRSFDIPWTHFVAAGVLGAMVLVSLTRLPLAIRAVLVGALAVTLAQTRMFEALVASIAGGLLLPLVILRHWRDLRARPVATLRTSLLQVALPAAAGGVLAFAAIGALSHNWSLYEQYGDVDGMVLAPQLAPLKAVQLFWDPCFATVCEFAPRRLVSPLADSFDAWQQPLFLQLPGLAASALCLLVLLILRPMRTLQLPLGLWFAVIAAGGITLAYLSGAPSGSGHLKYGFFRDFMAPLMLLSCAFIAAIAIQRADEGRWRVGLIVPLMLYFVVVIGLMALRPFGLPPLSWAEVARFEVTSTCTGGSCRFGLTAFGTDGKPQPYNDLGYAVCTNEKLDRPVQPVAELQVDAARCGRIAIIPVAAGVMLTPDEQPFVEPGLDLAKAGDSITVPPLP